MYRLNTCRSASFSSFISFSLAFVASRALRSDRRALYEFWPARGLNADFGMCQCFPARGGRRRGKGRRIRLVCLFFIWGV